MIIKREKSSHWYLPTGEPFYEIESKSKPGQMRPVTIKDARKVGALPSVTNVLGILSKPGLDAWKLEQAILSSLTLPKKVDEPIELFAQRIVKDMEAEAEEAAKKGTALHDACALYAKDKSATIDASLIPVFQPFREWFDKEIEDAVLTEAVLVNRGLGYAGRTDLVCVMKGFGISIVDIKTQKRNGKKFTAYPEWPLQLAAYASAYGTPDAQLISVILDREEPGIEIIKWKGNSQYFQAFLHAKLLWDYFKQPGFMITNE